MTEKKASSTAKTNNNVNRFVLYPVATDETDDRIIKHMKEQRMLIKRFLKRMNYYSEKSGTSVLELDGAQLNQYNFVSEHEDYTIEDRIMDSTISAFAIVANNVTKGINKAGMKVVNEFIQFNDGDDLIACTTTNIGKLHLNKYVKGIKLPGNGHIIKNEEKENSDFCGVIIDVPYNMIKSLEDAGNLAEGLVGYENEILSVV